jgi:hypothetical protein
MMPDEMRDDELVQWLFENGGPAIRYRTVAELMGATEGIDLEQLTADVRASAMAQLWMDRLGTPGDLFSFHGSNPHAFENVCAKLCELGLRAGTMAGCEERMRLFRLRLEQGDDFLGKPLVASCLNWAGYGGDQAIRACLARRLEGTYELARSGVYDIYVDHDTFGDCPAAFRKRPLVNPEYNDKLPGIWDIYALAHYPAALMNAEIARRIEAVVAYILHQDYQSLHEGYGYMRAGPRRYYSIGWSVHLPGVYGFEFSRPMHAHVLVQRLELMAHFAVARNTRWFKDCVLATGCRVHTCGSRRTVARAGPWSWIRHFGCARSRGYVRRHPYGTQNHRTGRDDDRRHGLLWQPFLGC